MASRPSWAETQPVWMALPVPSKSKLPWKSARAIVCTPSPLRSMTMGVMAASQLMSFWPDASFNMSV
ncbi:hypothetical protein D3C81_2242750 [compost metagenome]